MVLQISPGRSWYADNVGETSHFAPLVGEVRCDVAILGGGLTGLSAALHLARSGVNVVLLEQSQLGEGASGRNGGQMGTGQRQWVEALEKTYGESRSKALFDIAEQSKQDLVGFAKDNDIELQMGHLSVCHTRRGVKTYHDHVERMAHYGYKKLIFMDEKETAERLGSKRYFGGVRDTGTGHIHPLKLVFALAKQADHAGAKLYEGTIGKKLVRLQNGFRIDTITSMGDGPVQSGVVHATKVLIASNAYEPMLHPNIKSHIIPIRSYIGATPPLDDFPAILPQGESVDDSRFVVRYFRKSKNNALLFGGAESYADAVPSHLEQMIRKQLQEVYPTLANIPLSHVWGGTVAITVERMPYIRELEAGLLYCGGYSGHGVMLAPLMGRLVSDYLQQGHSELLKQMAELKITPFPGGRFLRRGLLFCAMKWFALCDRF